VLTNIPENQIHHVYFKENGQNGTVTVKVRAELIKISHDPIEDPEHRLPGFEHDMGNRFYLKVRNLEHLPNPLPLGTITRRNGNPLPDNGQGVQGVALINDPLTLAVKSLK
jgi:hypothetical protein